MLKKFAVLPLLLELSVEGAATKPLGVTYVDDTTVYSATKEYVNLMVPPVNLYVKNLSSAIRSIPLLLYRFAHIFLHKAVTGLRFASRTHLFFVCRVSGGGSAHDPDKEPCNQDVVFQLDAFV